jgi:hypothetical protein
MSASLTATPGSLTASQRAKCCIYVLIALAATIGTWAQNLVYLPLGTGGMMRKLFEDMLATPGARSISVDAFLLTTAVVLWMISEGRRLGMRSTWWYVLAGMTITISIFVPLFLAHREVVRAHIGDVRPGESLAVAEWVGFAVIAAVSGAMLAASFARLR